MVNYWWSVFWEGAGASIEAIGQPLQVLLYSLLILMLGWFFIIRKRGWHEGWKAVKQNVVKTFGEVVLIGIIAWTPFLIVHICQASYLRWKNADDATVAARSEASHLRNQLDDLNVPKLSGEIANMVYGSFPGTGGKDTALMVIASIKNTGAPSIADHMRLVVQIGNSIKNTIPILPGRETETFEGHGHSLIMNSSDYLPRRATSQPIPHGGEVVGFVQGLLRDVHVKDVRRTGMIVKLYFSDVNGKDYEAESPLGEDANFVDVVPGSKKHP